MKNKKYILFDGTMTDMTWPGVERITKNTNLVFLIVRVLEA